MYKKLCVIFGFLFVFTMLLWSSIDYLYKNNDKQICQYSHTVSMLTSSDNIAHQTNRYAFSILSYGSSSSACMIGENNGGRYSQYPAGRLLSIIRSLSGNTNIIHSGFLIFGDLRSLYGIVRAHLFFCRLQN